MKKMTTLFYVLLFSVSATFVGAQTKPVLTQINFLVSSGDTVTETSNGRVTVELQFDIQIPMNETVSPTVKFGLDQSFPLPLLTGSSVWSPGNIWHGDFIVSNLNPSTADGEYIFQVFDAESVFGVKMDTTLSTDPGLNKTLFICRSGELLLDTTTVDFGTVTLGPPLGPPTMTVTINNQSCAELNVSSISVPSPFRLVNPIGSFPPIPGNGSRLVTVEFNPTQRTSYSKNMTIISDDRFQTSRRDTVQLFGSGKGPRIEVSSNSVDSLDSLPFGKVEVGSDSTLSFLVSNPKAANASLGDTLNVSNIFTNSGVFTVSATELTIPPGSTKNVDVTFTPADRVFYNALMQIFSDDGITPIRTVSLSGNASDESAPPAITGLSVNFDIGRLISAGSLGLCWDPVNDPSGLAAVWYYFSRTPQLAEPDTSQTANSVGGRVVLQPNANCVSLPLLNRITSGLWYCYIWLEDGNGNSSWANRVEDFFYYDINPPGIPTIASRSIPELQWFSANHAFRLTLNIPVDESRNSRDAVEVFWKYQGPPGSSADFDGSHQFNPPIGETELFTVPFNSEQLCGDDSLYFWLADSAGNVDANNYALTRYRFDMCPPNITRILPDAQNIANLGQAFIDTVTITDHVSIDTSSIRLHYRFGGAESEEPSRRLTRISGTDTYILDIPDGGVTKRGVEYQVVATDDLGNMAAGPTSSLCDSDSLWFPVRTRLEGEGDFRIDIDGRPVPLVAGDTTNSYQLFSVPYDLDNGQVMQVLADDLGAYDNTMWRFFDFKNDGSISGCPENPELCFVEADTARDFTPGRSYFIITRQENIIVDGGPGQTRRTVCNDTVQVYEGWNLIATPFNFPVHKESLSLINSNSIVSLRSYAGGWNITDVMETWKGYALFVTSDNSNDDMYLVVIPRAAPGRASKVTADLGFEPGDWAVQISGQTGQIHDLENWAGVLQNARPGFDNFELAEPPVIGQFLKVSFAHPGWNLPTDEFSTDFRPAGISEQVWQFDVNTNEAYADVRLSFDFLGDFPANAEVHLIDEAVQSAHNLRANSVYSFKSGKDGAEKKLKLIVGSHQFATSQAGDIGLVPEQFELLQNFPNPFNPETSIRYNLPEASRVSIVIYDLLGRRVRTLIDSQQKETGYFTARWNGLDDLGGQVATGVYIYQLKTSSKSISRKMILLK
ncbi:choice-of-anchor D domain-containing protein [candidate division KSB1 bacterium]|nr:choice-of-anchor D domain-containing protein [candidate division KSB1 bacterium]